MATNSTFKPWLGGIISQFIGGLFHGSVVGAGGTTALDISSGQITSVKRILLGTVIAALIGAIKDVSLYVNENPMPNIFAQPVVAPIPGPVAAPTVSDQPSTLVSPSVAIKS